MNNFFKFLALFTLLIIVGLHAYLNRYELYYTNDFVYKLDRWSHELFFIKEKKEYLIDKGYITKKGMSDDTNSILDELIDLRAKRHKAIELVKNTHCTINQLSQKFQKEYYYLFSEKERTNLDNSLKNLTINDLILGWVKNNKGELTIHGWKVKTIDSKNGKFLVHFSFNLGAENFNYGAYEVHINQEIVRKLDNELSKIYEFTTDPGEDWKHKVDEIKELSNQNDKKEAEILISALRENDFAIQIEAIRMLAKRKEKSAVPELILLLKNDNTAVVDESSKALGQITGSDYGVVSVEWLSWWERNKYRYLMKGL